MLQDTNCRVSNIKSTYLVFYKDYSRKGRNIQFPHRAVTQSPFLLCHGPVIPTFKTAYIVNANASYNQVKFSIIFMFYMLVFPFERLYSYSGAFHVLFIVLCFYKLWTLLHFRFGILYRASFTYKLFCRKNEIRTYS